MTCVGREDILLYTNFLSFEGRLNPNIRKIVLNVYFFMGGYVDAYWYWFDM